MKPGIVFLTISSTPIKPSRKQLLAIEATFELIGDKFYCLVQEQNGRYLTDSRRVLEALLAIEEFGRPCMVVLDFDPRVKEKVALMIRLLIPRLVGRRVVIVLATGMELGQKAANEAAEFVLKQQDLHEGIRQALQIRRFGRSIFELFQLDKKPLVLPEQMVIMTSGPGNLFRSSLEALFEEVKLFLLPPFHALDELLDYVAVFFSRNRERLHDEPRFDLWAAMLNYRNELEMVEALGVNTQETNWRRDANFPLLRCIKYFGCGRDGVCLFTLPGILLIAWAVVRNPTNFGTHPYAEALNAQFVNIFKVGSTEWANHGAMFYTSLIPGKTERSFRNAFQKTLLAFSKVLVWSGTTMVDEGMQQAVIAQNGYMIQTVRLRFRRKFFALEVLMETDILLKYLNGLTGALLEARTYTEPNGATSRALVDLWKAFHHPDVDESGRSQGQQWFTGAGFSIRAGTLESGDAGMFMIFSMPPVL